MDPRYDYRSPAHSKRAARAVVRSGLESASPGERAAWSAAIRGSLGALAEVRRARVIMAFLPLPHEPDLAPLLASLLSSGVRLALPRVEWSSKAMGAFEVRDLDRDVTPGRHGLLEPGGGCAAVETGAIDAILIPGVAFDPTGTRLGRGGGFYDRFLAAPGLRAIRIGVCFELQIVDEVVREAHDAVMDLVVTEARVIRAG